MMVFESPKDPYQDRYCDDDEANKQITEHNAAIDSLWPEEAVLEFCQKHPIPGFEIEKLASAVSNYVRLLGRISRKDICQICGKKQVSLSNEVGSFCFDHSDAGWARSEENTRRLGIVEDLYEKYKDTHAAIAFGKDPEIMDDITNELFQKLHELYCAFIEKRIEDNEYISKFEAVYVDVIEKSKVILGEDFLSKYIEEKNGPKQTISKVYLFTEPTGQEVPKGAYCFPESWKNGKQIQEFVASMKTDPKTIITGSLYLLRELDMQKVPAIYINDGVESDNIDGLGNIEILDRELEQSSRYMDIQNQIELEEQKLREHAKEVLSQPLDNRTSEEWVEDMAKDICEAEDR